MKYEFTEVDAGYYIPTAGESSTTAVTITDRSGAYESTPIANRFEVYFCGYLVHVAPCMEFAEAWVHNAYSSFIASELSA